MRVFRAAKVLAKPKAVPAKPTVTKYSKKNTAGTKVIDRKPKKSFAQLTKEFNVQQEKLKKLTSIEMKKLKREFPNLKPIELKAKAEAQARKKMIQQIKRKRVGKRAAAGVGATAAGYGINYLSE